MCNEITDLKAEKCVCTIITDGLKNGCRCQEGSGTARTARASNQRRETVVAAAIRKLARRRIAKVRPKTHQLGDYVKTKIQTA